MEPRPARSMRVAAAEDDNDSSLPSFASLPTPLVACILRSVTSEAAEFCRLSLVCRPWRELVWGQRWTHLTSLVLHGSGGLSPLPLAPGLQSVVAKANAGSVDELQQVARLGVQQLSICDCYLSPAMLVGLASPALEKLHLEDCSIDVARLAALLASSPSLSALSVRDSPLRNVSARDAFVDELIAAGPRLTHLDLSGACVWLDTHTLSAIASSCRNLQLLDVSGAREVNAFPPFLLELPALRVLRAHASGLLDNHLAALSAQASRSACFVALEQLDVGGCYGLRSRGIGCLSDLLGSTTGPPLLHLNVSDLLDLSDNDAAIMLAAVERRAESQPSSGLALNVSCCGRLGASFFNALAFSGLKLSEFKACGLTMLDALTLIQLADAGVFKCAQVLDLSHCQLLEATHCANHRAQVSDALSVAARSAGDSLRRFALDGCCLTDDALADISASCPRLEDVSLVGTRVGGLGLRALSAGCGHLQAMSIGGSRCHAMCEDLSSFGALRTLRLHRCRWVERETLETIARGSPRLQTLSLAACGGVTDDALLLLAQAAPQLRSLALQAEDHPDLRGTSLHRLTGLRRLTLRQCPHVSPDSVLRLLAANEQVMHVELPLQLHLAISQRIPVRVPRDKQAFGQTHWRPASTVHLTLA